MKASNVSLVCKSVVEMLILCLVVMSLSLFQVGFAEKKYNLLIINSQEQEPYVSARVAFLAELKRLGYVEGVNLTVQNENITNIIGLVTRVMQDVEKQGKVFDCIVANGTIAGQGLKDIAFNNPKYKVVFMNITDPVGLGLIQGFGVAPQSNFTGVCYPVKVERRFKFIKDVMPMVKNIGFIYNDMPQSLSYKKWLDDFLAASPDFKSVNFIFRKTEYVSGEGGITRMIKLAENLVNEIKEKVDLFVCSNDQVGISADFVKMLKNTCGKPILGLDRPSVMENGATMAIFPMTDKVGIQVAAMVKLLFSGKGIRDIPAEWPKEVGTAFNLTDAGKYGIVIPPDMLKAAGDNIVK